MKKVFILALIVAIILSACGSVKANVPSTSDAKLTQAILEKYISAYQTFDSDKLMSFYADNITWMDYGCKDGPYDKANLDLLVHQWLGQREIKVKFESYLLTADSSFAVVQGDLTMKNITTHKWISTQAIVILELISGKIVNESWYYNCYIYF
jgi:ketosteroid isomerase-like protein